MKNYLLNGQQSARCSLVVIMMIFHSLPGSAQNRPERAERGYRVVPAPIQAVVPSLPAGYETVVVDGTQYLYYGGTFYIPYQNRYQVTEAPAGAVIINLPEGCEQVQMGNVAYLRYNNTYFQPVSVNNQPAYEVVNME